MKIKKTELKKRVLKIYGENNIVLTFRVVNIEDEMEHQNIKKPYVRYRNSYGWHSMMVYDFIKMISEKYVISKDRYNYFIEPIGNEHCDNEIYPTI